MFRNLIAAIYEGGHVASYLLLISKQHAGNYIEMIAKHDGSHADYATGNAFNAWSKMLLWLLLSWQFKSEVECLSAPLVMTMRDWIRSDQLLRIVKTFVSF